MNPFALCLLALAGQYRAKPHGSARWTCAPDLARRFDPRDPVDVAELRRLRRRYPDAVTIEPATP